MLLCCSAWLLTAQGLGGITGQVLDGTAAAVPGARVRVESAATGFGRDAYTTADGYYSIPDLPIGSYSVRVSRAGFQTILKQELRIGIGERLRTDFVLSPQGGAQTLEVHEDLAGRSTSPGEGTAFSQRALTNLPINGRDYARFTLLAAGGLARSNQIADLSFNGMHSVHNHFTIDGVDATRVDQPFVSNGAERGARLLTGSMEAVAEFRVETANYAPEFGRSAGAYINIATRSGTNSFHGALFEYARNSFLDARNFFNSKPAPQAPFRYHDFGAAVAGPIRRNSTFFHANYEGSRQRLGVTGAATVPSETVRQQILATSPALAPVLAEIPAGGSATGDPRVDRYTASRSLAVREDTGSVKLSRGNGGRARAWWRLNLNDSMVAGPLFATQSGAVGVLDRQIVPARTANSALAVQHVLSPRVLNDFLAGMQRVRMHTIADHSRIPVVMVTGLTASPGSRGRSEAANTSYQAGDSLSFASGVHTLKAGFAARAVRLVRGASNVSILTYTSIDDLVNNRAAAATVVAGNPGSEVRNHELGAWVQDSWQPFRGLTLDYGLRYDYFGPPFDPQGLARPYDPAAGALALPGAPFFRRNTRNFAPRLSAAWNVRERFSVRAGFGLFFGAFPPGLGAIDGNTRPGSYTIRASQFPGLSYPLPAFDHLEAAPKPAVTGFDPNRADLYNQQWSLTADWLASRLDTFRAAYVGSHGVHLRRQINTNFIDPATGRPPNPAFSSIYLETAAGNSSYQSLQLSWTRSLNERLTAAVHYVWAHAIDDVPDPAAFASTQPQDNGNLRAERGNGSGDVRHRLSGNMVYELPRFSGAPWGRWTLAAIAQIRTGLAQSIVLGTNPRGNGNLVNQRPDAVPGVDPYARRKSPDGWFDPAAFRMPAPGTFGNLGRNTVFGPRLFQVDASVQREFRVTDHLGCQVRIEGFNLANHPNFAQPNNVLGTAAFGRTFSTLGNTIGMGTARQIQAAVRLSF